MGYVSMDDWWTPGDPHLTSSPEEQRRKREEGRWLKRTNERNETKGYRGEKEDPAGGTTLETGFWLFREASILGFSAPGTRSRRAGYSSSITTYLLVSVRCSLSIWRSVTVQSIYNPHENDRQPVRMKLPSCLKSLSILSILRFKRCRWLPLDY